MAADSRNFRSHYYEKMGFRGVEEKKSLDILLSEQPVELKRLQNFCLRFAVPGIYRSQVWRLVLGVLPVHSNNTEWVWTQRREQWRELRSVLQVTKKITSCTEASEACCIVWLLETRQLKFDLGQQLEEPRNKNFISIASSLYSILETEEEVYWVTKKMVTFLDSSLSDMRAISECFGQIMKEDSVLYSHLDKIGALTSLPFGRFIGSGLAAFFPPVVLEKLWDKVVGGSARVLVYVLAAAVYRCRTDVLQADSCHQVERLLSEMKEDRGEVVLSQGCDMWADHGCPLLFGNTRQMSGGGGCGEEGVGDRGEMMTPLVGVPIRRPSLHEEDPEKLENRMSTEIAVGGAAPV